MVNKERYLSDLEYVSKVRPADSENWLKVQTYCMSRLQALGFETELQTYTTGVNVIGKKTGGFPGSGSVIISAHYDTVAGSGGADDNGTGIAGALEAAYVLSKTAYEHTLIVAFWDEEETGLIGARHYAQNAKTNNANIIISIVLEMIGFYSEATNSQQYPAGFSFVFPDQIKAIADNNNRGDFITCAYDQDAASWYNKFSAYASASELTTIAFPLTDAQTISPAYEQLCRSDHAAFWSCAYPAVMITDSAEYRNPNYHSPSDTLATLNHDFAVQVIKAVVASSADVLVIDQ